jgi:hypothetical protein
LDLDCNKEGTPIFEHRSFLNLMMYIQRSVTKKFDIDPDVAIAQGVESGKPLGWVEQAEEGSEREINGFVCLVSGQFRKENLYSYHLVWPFIFINKSRARDFWNDVFSSGTPGTYRDTAKPDINAILTGSLRMCWSIKTPGSGYYLPLCALNPRCDDLWPEAFIREYAPSIGNLFEQKEWKHWQLSG